MSSVTKLTNQNYLMWRRQVRALLEGHELQQFIDDSSNIPAPTIFVDGVSTSNPAHAPRKRQDRLLYSAIIGPIFQYIQSVVSTATTTKEVLDSLAETFGNPTRGHVRQLKYQIKTFVKGSKSVSENLRIIKAKADDLALLGKPLDPEDLTEQILAGLSTDYKQEIDAINGCDNPISYTELYERLVNREAIILCTDATTVTSVVANATNTRSRQQNCSNTYTPTRSNNNPQSQNRYYGGNNNSNQNRFSKPNLGKCQ